MARSKFQAPRVVQDFATVQRALLEIQESLDAATRSRAMLKVYTSDFSLVAGGFHRVSAPTGRNINARLPAATGANLSEPVVLHLEGMLGAVRVAAAPGQLVNGQPYATFDVDGVVSLWSNGVNAWTGVAQLPAESPGGAALDARYVLGAAHASLPNGAVATDTSEINVTVSPGTTATWALIDGSVGLPRFANVAAGTFLGNVTGSTGPVTANSLTTLAGAGLTYSLGVMAVGAGSFITVSASDVGVNLSTLVPAIDSASVVANGSVLERAALTGAISAAQESNQTLFAGIRDNGLLETARTHLNFVSTAFDTTFSVTQDAVNDELEVRVATLGSFYAENDVGAIQTKFISFDDGIGTVANVVDNTGTSGYINVSYDLDYSGTTSLLVLSGISGNQGTVDISALECGGTLAISAPTAAWEIEGFTSTPVKPDGFWFFLSVANTNFPGTLFDEDATATTTDRLRLSNGADHIAMAIQATVHKSPLSGLGGSARWFVVAGDRGNEVQAFATAGLTSDLALNSNTRTLRVDTGNSAWSIDGIAGGWHGRKLTIENASNLASTGTLVTQGSSASAAANQIITPDNVNRGGYNRYSAELEYDGTDGFWRITADTGPGSGPGRLLRVSRYTSGSALTHTWLAGATTAIIDIVSSGGGGGSVANPAAAQCTLGGGGCSGTWVRALWTIDTATATYTVGAGAAGNASGNLSSFTDGTDTISCPGGPVGGVLASGTSLTYVLGGSAGASAATLTGSGFTVLNHNGGSGTLRPNAGGHGLRHSGTVAMSGFGAPSPFSGGGSGAGRQSSGVGAAGAAPGAAGGGACSFNAAGAFAGGASLAGIIVIYEYS
jgi:hypothetical protein